MNRPTESAVVFFSTLRRYHSGRFHGHSGVILGILSDSHGDATITNAALALLARRGAERFIHCGDLGSVGVLDALSGRDCLFVWGNCDDPMPALRPYVSRIGLSWPVERCELTLNEKRIAVFHGHERTFDEAVRAGRYDYILHGHTHRPTDERIGHTRVINPGALYRARIRTVATLNVIADTVQFYDVETGRKLTLKQARN